MFNLVWVYVSTGYCLYLVDDGRNLLSRTGSRHCRRPSKSSTGVRVSCKPWRFGSDRVVRCRVKGRRLLSPKQFGCSSLRFLTGAAVVPILVSSPDSVSDPLGYVWSVSGPSYETSFKGPLGLGLGLTRRRGLLSIEEGTPVSSVSPVGAEGDPVTQKGQ